MNNVVSHLEHFFIILTFERNCIISTILINTVKDVTSYIAHKCLINIFIKTKKKNTDLKRLKSNTAAAIVIMNLILLNLLNHF